MRTGRVTRTALRALVAAAALALAGAAGAAVFTDPTGDSGTAPDVATVEVTNDARSRVTFRLTLANRPEGLTAGDHVVLFLNTDRNGATGDREGDDVVIEFAEEGFDVAAWRDGGYESVAAASARVSRNGGTYTLTIARADLGGTRGFELTALSVRIVNGTLEAGEPAPDAGEWVYRLAVFCVVPNVRGKTLAAAKRALRKANCDVGKVTRRSSSARRGRVVGESPRRGAAAREGKKVDLVVSRGRRP